MAGTAWRTSPGASGGIHRLAALPQVFAHSCGHSGSCQPPAPAGRRLETRGKILGGGRGENVKPIKTPFTFVAVKLYRDFSTHDMNNNQAFFSVIAKAPMTVRPFASRLIPGRRPRAGGPGEGAQCPGWSGNPAAAFRGSQLGVRPPCPPGRGEAAGWPAGLVHSNLQR